uniref:Major facilitator superfamily (MFS) profile domain-containing protein n=2 Tax=Rhodosorus marinus TaxID=101924 RepID=A0A7S3ABJ4_9RHOD|mmetsp:Transcript_8467/g.37757  ORF Transcript_8467/g.37757 Transcript_8467/m.37757 type:complete len:479 (+) Transcript_8467:203-1639(+)|eukprot:CAMPEP_0113960772 /NCGR_PEP_ID=MMETSP0011_2-20120614/4913_1 /TAXON_ID=101924 /ORGANISM="Rhodosorus marinus" /LENGTH=478 /DNA_ID=CAMNT_0000972287 /DNA_START=150 /DNA_END=1586 /DNA_ORIENTATION=+ /assembly_acc=CAM_ASM_000156
MVGGGAPTPIPNYDPSLAESDDAVKGLAEDEGPLAPKSSLFGVAVGLLGMQFAWSVQIGYVTKALLELGVSRQFVALAWLAGPIAGIVMQPIVGWYSDRNTSRFGRRRPFIVVGVILAVFMMIIFGFGDKIGKILGDTDDHKRAIIVSVTAFWFLDFAINAAQGPVRTLLVDIAPPSQQAEGNSYLALGTSLGNFLGSLMGSLDLKKVFSFFHNDVSAIYTLGAFVLLASAVVCVIFARETPATAEEIEVIQNSTENGFSALRRACAEAPSAYWKIYGINCFTWFAWFTLFIYGTSWVGAEVMGGSESAEEGTESRTIYDDGVRLGNLGFSLQSVVSIVYSIMLNFLMSRFGKLGPYIFSQIVQAVILSCCLFVKKAVTAIVMFGVLGICWANSMAVPWAIVGEITGKNAPELAGMYITIFNSSQAFPEVLVSIVAQWIVRATGSQTIVLVMGGGVATLGALVLCIAQIDLPVMDPYF